MSRNSTRSAINMSSDSSTSTTDTGPLIARNPGQDNSQLSLMKSVHIMRMVESRNYRLDPRTKGKTTLAAPSLSSLNIGTIGHVAHGKSTLVRAITGAKTMRHKAEIARNMTIKLGHASGELYRCSSDLCPRPECYKSWGSGQGLQGKSCLRDGCQGVYSIVRKVSFVDCPGHDILMRTMLTGTSAMDAALLVISADEKCPQPQTIEHLAAIEALGLKKVIVVQNKIDVVGEEVASKHARQVRRFLKGTVAEDAPIVPISAQMNLNIDAVLDKLANIEPPIRDFTSPPRMTIVRSFDVNRPGSDIAGLKGGVAGGTLTRGVLHLHDEIESRPGLIVRDLDTGKASWRSLYSRVVSLSAESQQLDTATPGTLVGVGTLFAPELCRGDRLVGQVLGLRDTLPPVFASITIHFKLLRGLKSKSEDVSRGKINKGEILMLNVGSAAVQGTVSKTKGHKMVVDLKSLVCTDPGEKVALSNKVNGHWRLAGWGNVVDGAEAKCDDQ